MIVQLLNWETGIGTMCVYDSMSFYHMYQFMYNNHWNGDSINIPSSQRSPSGECLRFLAKIITINSLFPTEHPPMSMWVSLEVKPSPVKPLDETTASANSLTEALWEMLSRGPIPQHGKSYTINIWFLCLFFLGPHLWHMEVHRIEVESELGNAWSLTHWVRPVIEPVYSWRLVRFVSTEPW